MGKSATLSYEEYREARYFPSLDGVRAISVLLVVLWHMRGWAVLERLNGWTGVTLFFVLSGFLITTLMVREARSDRRGRFDLVGFYIRRVHRILPLYFLTLAIAVVLWVVWRGVLVPPVNFGASLGYYATLSTDLIHHRTQPLGHLWSVGVEEKFYLVWPLALLVLLRLPRPLRTIAGAALVAIPTMSTNTPYVKLYLGITLGCLLAFVLDGPRTYAVIRRAAAFAGGLLLVLSVAALAIVQIKLHDLPRGSQLFAYVGVATTGLLVVRANGVIAGSLSSRPARWIGRRSYGIYLLHPFAVHGVEQVIPLGHDAAWPLFLGRGLVMLAVLFALADLAHRTIEVPMIRRGRRIAQARAERRRATSAGTAPTPAPEPA